MSALAELLRVAAEPQSPRRLACIERLGAEGDGSAESVAALLGCLHELDPAVVEAAVRGFIAMDADVAVPALVPLLREPGLGPRNAAIQVLRVSGARSLPTLVGLTVDADPDVRLFAVELLRHVGGAEILAPLVRALADENPNVAIQAAASLGASGAPEAVGPLIACLERPSAWLATAALGSLAELGGQQALDAVLAFSRSARGAAQAAGVTALGRFGRAEALPLLATLLAGRAGRLWQLAQSARASILAALPVGELPAALADCGPTVLSEFLLSPDVATVRLGLLILRRLPWDRELDERLAPELLGLFLRDTAALRADLEALLVVRPAIKLRAIASVLDRQDSSLDARRAAVRVLGAMGDPQASEILVEHMRQGDPSLILELIHALGRLPHARSLAMLAEVMAGEDPVVRLAAINAIVMMGTPDALLELERWLGDASPAIRLCACSGLRGQLPEPTRVRLIRALDDGSPLLESAAQLLADSPPDGFHGRLLDLLERGSVADVGLQSVLAAGVRTLTVAQRARLAACAARHLAGPDEAARIAAIRTTAALADPESVEPLLALLASDPSERVRYEAARSLGRSDDVEVTRALCELLPRATPFVQTALVEVLGVRRSEPVQDALRTLAADDGAHRAVREAAQQALDAQA